METGQKVFICFLICYGLFVVFLLVDGLFSNKTIKPCVIIDKQYKPEENSSGVGYGLSADGKMGVAVISEHEDEKYLLICRGASGEYFTSEVKPDKYYSVRINDIAEYCEYLGYFTKYSWMKKVK